MQKTSFVVRVVAWWTDTTAVCLELLVVHHFSLVGRLALILSWKYKRPTQEGQVLITHPVKNRPV